jgi:ubiquinone/menaquinone biosynthesis C-methylase UbiE
MGNVSLDPQLKNTDQATGGEPAEYALGYSTAEFKRLELQGRFFGDLTEDVLRRAGVGPAMRVLDIGCGVGDVSLIAARLVGPSGSVLGIDRSVEAVSTAQRRVAEAGQQWVRFATSELDAFSTDEKFDAVIGRLILLYLPDPSAALRRLVHHVRPAGIVAFQEMEMSLCRSVPDTPLFHQCREFLLNTFKRAGVEMDMGTKLSATYKRAGLPAPQMIAAARVEAGADSFAYEYLAITLRSLLPMAERLNVATAAEVGIDTLAERLRREALEHGSCVMPPTLIGAWTNTAA